MTDVKPKVVDQTVFVVGHPRSGTSLACQLVQSAGVDFPSDFEGDQYNREGYFELERGKKVSKKLMDEAMTQENTEEMNKVIDRLNERDDWAGLKIVRAPAFFFYRHLAEEMKLVLIYRNPRDVKSSMLRRGISQFPVPWAENNNAMIAAYENVDDAIIISYESLLSGEAFETFEKIGLDVDESIVDTGQRTQKNSDIVLSDKEKRVYEKLQELEEQQ
ncbi:MAG: sulfotransferase domain-containing protein [Candidatus Nanohaloarchaea archaeon]